MISKKEQIEVYLNKIEYDDNFLIINDILEFIHGLLSEDISPNSERIAALFCRTISKISQEATITSELQKNIIDAFTRINRASIKPSNNSELCTLYLLNILFNSNKTDNTEDISELIDSDYIYLLDNLDKIKILFTLENEDGVKFFPIERFLIPILDSQNFIHEIQKPKNIQALMISLQVFDINSYPDEIEEIKKFATENNLKFITYLFIGGCILGDSEWKNNYEKNGTLILYNQKTNKILIRNSNPKYFNINSTILNKYGIQSIEKEKGNGGAFFTEYILPSPRIILNINEELLKEDNSSIILSFLRLIYNENYYNVIFPQNFIINNDELIPVNPFAINDKYFIFGGKCFSEPIIEIKKWLRKYSLIKITGNSLNYINLGMITSLFNIKRVNILDLEIKTNTTTFDGLLIKWISLCDDKQEVFNLFLSEYSKELEFISTPESLCKKKYQDEFWLPLQIPYSIFKSFDITKFLENKQLLKGNFSFDFINSKQSIVSDTNDFSNYLISNLDGEIIERIDEENCHFILDSIEGKIYYDKRITTYVNLKNETERINNEVLSAELISVISEFHVSQLLQCIKLFQHNFQIVHKDIPLNSYARYRLAFHLLLIKQNLTKENFIEWYNLIIKHEKINYSIVNYRDDFIGQDCVLYVPKNASNTQSTLKNISIHYLSKITRKNTDIYSPIIKLDEKGRYLVNNCLINTICFVFDLIQEGSSSIGTLNYYLDENSQPNNKFMSFFCDNKPVKITDIISKNTTENRTCKIEIASIYASKEGLENIDNYIKTNFPDIKYKIDTPLQYINTKADDNDIQVLSLFYNGIFKGKMNVGNFLNIREFNQPRINIMANIIMKPEYTVSIFCRQ